MEGDDDTTSYLVGLHRGAQRGVRGALDVVAARPGAAGARARRHRELRGPRREFAVEIVSVRPVGCREPGRARRRRARAPGAADPADRVPGRVHAPRPRGHRPGPAGAARRRPRTRGRVPPRVRRACSTTPSGSARSNRALRDALLDAGGRHRARRVRARTPASEMLLDGALVADPRSSTARAARPRLAIGADADAWRALAPPDMRDEWIERLRMIGSSLEPAATPTPAFVAERLHRMTAGRRRIELRGRAGRRGRPRALDRVRRPAIADAAPAVSRPRSGRRVPIPHRPA